MTVNNFQPNNTLGNYLPEQIWLPEDQVSFQSEVKRTLEDQAKMVNRKDTGSYESNEQIINQQYFGADPQTKRYVFRKVVLTGALPNVGATATPHGITGIDATWMFTRIYGMARDPTNIRWMPFPNSNNLETEVYVDATNINIRTTVNLSSFTYSFVVLEYLKN